MIKADEENLFIPSSAFLMSTFSIISKEQWKSDRLEELKGVLKWKF